MSILSVWFTKTFLNKVEVKEISSDVIEDIIANFDCPYYRVRDSKYRLVNKKDFEFFLEQNLTDKYPYEKDYFDCDDFALKLVVEARHWKNGLAMGYCVIVESDRKHAMNILFDIESKVWIVEPQTDKMEQYNGQEIEFILI